MTIKLALGTALLLSAFAPMTAAAQDVAISAGADYVTEYVFRGNSFADEAVQPYIEAGFGNFTAGVWGSFAAGEGADDIDEIDLYASYSFPVGEGYSLDAGITYYHYPAGGSLFETEDGGAGSYEASLSLGFDAPFAPSITGFYDFTLEAFTIEGGVSHSVPLTDVFSFDLGASAGLVDGDGFSYEYGNASAALGYAISDTVSAYVGGNVALSSDETLDYKRLLAGGGDKSHLWFGTGLAVGF